MKLTLILGALLATSASAASSLGLDVKEELRSADATGPHRTTSARTIGLVHGRVVPEYLALTRGCVLKTSKQEVANFARGETLEFVSQNLQTQRDRNCLSWGQTPGGDDYCAVEGKPLEALQLNAEYVRLSGEKISLYCRILNTVNPSDMDTHLSDSFGSLLERR
jgi:hypothetical protein